LIAGKKVSVISSTLNVNGGKGGTDTASTSDGGGGGGGGRIKILQQTGFGLPNTTSTIVSYVGGSGGCCGGILQPIQTSLSYCCLQQLKCMHRCSLRFTWQSWNILHRKCSTWLSNNNTFWSFQLVFIHA
jgi:hypothetical protein